jgi:hypothetical protein
MEHKNSGILNSGDRNSGDLNSGYSNSGYSNSGDSNSGYRNSGNWNSGDWNSGNRNSGNWNSGYSNSGYLNTTEPKVRIFNRECDVPRDEFEFPAYFFFNLTEWVEEKDMTEEEKSEYYTYKMTGGFLRVYGYKEAWRKSWDKASDEDRRKTLSLPNWNNEIFKEISGIDVEAELSVKGKEYSLDEIADALGVDVKDLKIKK